VNAAAKVSMWREAPAWRHTRNYARRRGLLLEVQEWAQITRAKVERKDLRDGAVRTVAETSWPQTTAATLAEAKRWCEERVDEEARA
jgi:hypothetical protein